MPTITPTQLINDILLTVFTTSELQYETQKTSGKYNGDNKNVYR